MYQRDTVSGAGCPWCTAVCRNGKRVAGTCKTVEGRGPKVIIKRLMSYPLRQETSGRISTCKFGLRIRLASSTGSRTNPGWSSGFDKDPLIIRERLRKRRKREFTYVNSTKSEAKFDRVNCWSSRNVNKLGIARKVLLLKIHPRYIIKFLNSIVFYSKNYIVCVIYCQTFNTRRVSASIQSFIPSVQFFVKRTLNADESVSAGLWIIDRSSDGTPPFL